MTDMRDVEELMSTIDEGSLDSVAQAGLSSQPPHLADPLLLLRAGLSPWSFLRAAIDSETEALSDAIGSIETKDEVVFLECAAQTRNAEVFDELTGVYRCFSISMLELGELLTDDDHRYLGELRDAFRWLKMNQGPTRTLVWGGVPMHRYAAQAFPYYLRYIGQVMGGQDRLLMYGNTEGSSRVGEWLSSAGAETSATRLIQSCVEGETSGSLRTVESGEQVALHFVGEGPWSDGDASGVILNSLALVNEGKVEEAISFAGLHLFNVFGASGGNVWCVGKTPK